MIRAQDLIRSYPDHPTPGITFRDITPLLADAQVLRDCSAALMEPFAESFDVVAGIEARGFIFASTVAMLAGTGIIPLRKPGKPPHPVATVEYDLEYGTDRIEISEDLRPGMRVLLIDDVLATGGTLAAGTQLIEHTRGQVAGVAVVMELEGLPGRERIPEVHSLFSM